MKILLNTLWLAMIASVSLAQKPDNVLARVSYIYSNKKDTLSNGQTRIENMILFVGKNASLYTSYDKIRHEISEDQKFRAMIMSQPSNGRPKAFVKSTSESNWMTKTSYLHFIKEKKFFGKEFISLQTYIYEDKVPEIKWMISKDTLSFSGVLCQKASGIYEGKNWTAWFAPGLPFQSGPWKLCGLPGLIIEAYDESKTVHFQFAGIANTKTGELIRPGAKEQGGSILPIDQILGLDITGAYFDNVIALPQNSIKTTSEQLEKLKQAFEKDPKGFVRAQSGY